ncbi:cobalamin-independent methionine synthase II family protein [Amycolatopsis sp. BJA-103]|uniref:cobalamin-independent methionine synthase II family protein n=1 Tax=Amycolatopsis sp. BJA-103 TaxID=1911175 RepID=UPI000C75BDA6|nr:cobalamin-independent methionine synthase II family protein [Amycolatopsis sp. BJA-103]AUI58497.1 5-methyltetrahydropteroyltriglutamate--homocysteine methyltransferase [Amycolatopsis sp. BJA-103]PNE15177.1 5-methyltetrahydropteroyltriglutamate--homocysteine methyltransferase [Amycolatopsis sp. BJA-103]
MTIPTEPIGSIPRPGYLVEALGEHAAGRLDADGLGELQEKALVDTIKRLEETGSPVITDGEQGKPSFATYPLAGLTSLAPDGVVIPFADGHTRQLPRLTAGPFRYQTYADSYLREAKKHATKPVKQAVIAASAIGLVYPGEELAEYAKEQFIADLVNEAEADIRRSLDAGADSVQIDFTEGRLSLKLDPSGGLLKSFVDLNNAVLERFSDEERKKIGVHTCPGGDQDSVHSLDVDYAGLLPTLFQLKVGNVYVQLASEADPERALQVIADHAQPDQRIFVGVTDPIDPRVETAEEIRDRVLQAARFISPDRLGTCDDCGFSPFADDTSTSRETAFAKIAARVEGTRLAAESLL